MKPGDLVTYAFQAARWRKGLSVNVGLIVEVGKYTGNTDVKVLWTNTPNAQTEKSSGLMFVKDIRIP
jgi:hypothetical protein